MPPLPAEFWQSLQDATEILKPIYLASVRLQQQRKPVISIIFSTLHMLYTKTFKVISAIVTVA